MTVSNRMSIEDARALIQKGRCSRIHRPRALFELTLVQQIVLAKLPAPVLEHRVCAERKFRFDLAWPDRKIALEIDGAIWTNGRHSRGGGIQRDCEKFSLAAIHGWRLLRVTTDQVKSGKALNFVRLALSSETEVATCKV